MPEPSGAVTFLFTDIEGSTVLWETHPSAMKETLAAHDALMRATFDRHGGYVFAKTGDGFGVAFTSPPDAALAALELQEELADAEWPHGGPLRVRMAIDTGIAHERDGDYFGPTVNRVARSMGNAVGGQVLVTATTADLLRHQLPSGVALFDHGTFRLRGVESPVALFELSAGTPTPKRSPLLRRGVAAAVVVLAIAGGTQLLPESAKEQPVAPSVSGSTATEAVAEEAPPPPMWETTLGSPAEFLAIAGGVVVTGQRSADGVTLIGFALEDGRELWRADHAQVSELRGHGSRFVLASRAGTVDRLDFVDPASGKRLVGCGFVFPTAAIAIGTDVVTPFIMDARDRAGSSFTLTDEHIYAFVGLGTAGEADTLGGSTDLLQVPYDLERARCLGPTVLRPDPVRWPPAVSGPAVAGRQVFIGDSGTLYAFATNSLQPDWTYFPGAGKVAGYDGKVGQVAAREVTYLSPTGSLSEVVVFALDGNGAIHRVSKGEAVAILEGAVGPIIVTDWNLIMADPDAELRAVGHDLVTEMWRTEVGGVAAGPVVDGDTVVIATESDVHVLDAETGSTTWKSGVAKPPVRIVAMDGFVAVADAMGGVAVFNPRGLAAPPVPDPDARSQPDPVDVATRFYAAMDAGDTTALEALIGIDLVFPEHGSPNKYTSWHAAWWNDPATQAAFWNRVGALTALGARTALGACEALERLDGMGSEVVCEVTHHDDFHDIFGVEFSGTTHVVISDGLVRMLYSGQKDDRELDLVAVPGFFFTMKVGALRGLDLGVNTGEMFERTWAWAEDTHPAEMGEACADQTPLTVDAQCARYLLGVAPEFAATLP